MAPSPRDGSRNAPKISSRALRRRLPRAVGGFTVNVCRNPHCSLFGLEPDPFNRQGHRGPHPTNKPRGSVNIRNGDLIYKCPSCGSEIFVKSNLALVQEYSRLSWLHRRTNRKHCPKETCRNARLRVDLAPSAYRRFGRTEKGIRATSARNAVGPSRSAHPPGGINRPTRTGSFSGL